MDKINQLLIVDDNPEDQQVYERYIKKTFGEKINVTILDKGAPAIEFIKNNKIDCILLDYQLPDMTGIGFLEKIKNQHDDIPIIMLTGTGNEKIAVEALKAGAYDYLSKGELRPDILYKTIANAVEKSILAKKIQEKEEEIKYLAYHDYLTGIPNRVQFEDKIRTILSQSQKTKQNFAILLIDLDRFKAVNDKHGHEAGDLLLKKVSKLFLQCLNKDDILARVGGDEFAIIVGKLQSPEYASHLAKKLIEKLSNSFIINENSITISPSIGIAYYPAAGETISKLISNADIALYQAKNAGKNTFRFFTNELNIMVQEHLDIENALQDALDKNDFYLAYQPILNVEDQSLFGLEVLLRSNNDFLKKIPIDKIIEIANEMGIIIPLGYWIIERAFQQMQIWQNNQIKSFKLCINLSARQLSHENWIEKLISLIQQYQIDPNNIIFELTESDVLLDLETANTQLSLITGLGCQIFIDDFGTGYSSLNLIRKLPISGLKIDKSFMNQVESDPINSQLVRSIISLANNLNLILVIEGIETKTQFNFIKPFQDVKCQGFYFWKPLTPAEINQLKLLIPLTDHFNVRGD